MNSRRRSGLAGGLVLILLGAWFLIAQRVPGLQAWFSWPWIIIGVGLLLLIVGLVTGVPGMAVPAGAFVINGPQQEVVGYIDLDGNMCIRGELNELAHCEAGGGGFAVRDWFGNIVARVDLFGNLCLAGRLHQNPLP